MSELTVQQQAVVDAPMAPLCVIACAGSGKTKTAVQRLGQMRRALGNSRGRIALLSFSNVAVDTFRTAYDVLARELAAGVGRERVEIDTLDAFITGNVLRPHGHRAMKATQAAYLVTGEEEFLDGFKFATATFPMPIKKLRVTLAAGAERFFHMPIDELVPLPTFACRSLVDRLGKTGAYTHELGRYWAYRVLKEHPELVAVIVHRYPHILIDEAQDIGAMHQAILQILINAGCCVTLIGDPNQGIYNFAGADGGFLRDYHRQAGVLPFALERNFRSVPSIVTLANSLCGRGDDPERAAPDTLHGAYFTSYKRKSHGLLTAKFQEAMAQAGANVARSAILCRGRPLAQELRGDREAPGVGVIKLFAQACVLRDRRHDFLRAFQHCTTAIVTLLANPPRDLMSKITQPARYPDARALRREIWAFTRDPAQGLPSASLAADSHWHSKLVTRVKALLATLQAQFGLQPSANLGLRLKKSGLPATPLWSEGPAEAAPKVSLRVDTVHQAKGESLDAVLYMTLREHAEEFLNGVGTEVGRIGYVAATRARNLLWVAVPDSALKELRQRFLDKGFVEVDGGVAGAAKPKSSEKRITEVL